MRIESVTRRKRLFVRSRRTLESSNLAMPTLLHPSATLHCVNHHVRSSSGYESPWREARRLVYAVSQRPRSTSSHCDVHFGAIVTDIIHWSVFSRPEPTHQISDQTRSANDKQNTDFCNTTTTAALGERTSLPRLDDFHNLMWTRSLSEDTAVVKSRPENYFVPSPLLT